MTVLLLANHESNTWEFRGEIYEVQPGQFITSLDSLKEHCASDVTTQNIRTALLKLEKHGFLTNESTKKNRLITVVNWGIYQGCAEPTNKGTNRQPTNNQQTGNNQLTTNKNDKEVNKEEEEEAAYARVIDYYQRNIGFMAPLQYEYVIDWLKTFEADVLMYAIRLAVDRGAPKWAYVNRTLEAWHRDGAKTLEDCKALTVQFENKNESKGRGRVEERKAPQLDLYVPTEEEVKFLENINKRRSEAGNS
ncbi:hypothetical protein J42TS3_49530 [Paenibacillus vini]|uniref:DnaB/C C-terminal domain-containing protein n=2 Tax=Paenibacillus vini TaxID=1476024 RepID=A0ABQ4MIW0_9BACL|nr:hypothetical protein J42TS3_49530 [Paenibacillus vini]